MAELSFSKASALFLHYLSTAKQVSPHTLRNYNIDMQEFACFFKNIFLLISEEEKNPSFLVQQ